MSRVTLLVSGLLALLLPTLLVAEVDPLHGGVAVLAVALVALIGLALHGIGGRAHLAGTTLRPDDGPVLILAGRVTDPTHHPVRPRAPGPA